MERTKINKKPSNILCSDFHLKEDTPLCYTGDYQKEQWDSVDFVSNLQIKYDCPVLHAGDLFDHWKPSPNLLRLAILHLPKQFFTIYGQHDIPQHSLDLTHKCGINTLAAGKHLQILSIIHYMRDTLWVGGVHWGQEPTENVMIQRARSIKARKILVWHKMNYKGQPPWPGCTDPSAIKLLKKYSQYDLILTGDNHKSFTQEYEGRWLVNPGSLMRMDADQENHKPRVYLWYAEDNSIVPVYIPIKQDVISREHIEQKKQRDNRIDNFVKRLNSDWKASLTFEENLEIFKKKNKVPQDIMSIIYEAIEPIKK